MLDLLQPPPAARKARQELMHACACATAAEMEQALARLVSLPAATDMRPAETGLVMLRGRIGGDGAPFNVGEATVTRAVVRLANGVMGFSYLLGRSASRARLAAVIDAAGQDAGFRALLEEHLVRPVAARMAAARQVQREEVAATRVEFFTLVRGED